jgi:hypothetical protein
VERSAIFGISFARHGGCERTREKQGANDGAGLVADLAFGKFRDDDAAVAKRVLEMQLAVWLRQHISDSVVDCEGFDLVQDRTDGSLDEVARPHVELALEEPARDRIFRVLDDASMKVWVGEEEGKVEECRARGIEEGNETVAKNALELRPPGVAPDVVHRSDDAFDQETSLIARDSVEEIEGDRVVAVG